MIIMLPIMTLLLRTLVIRQRLVNLTTADQKQLYVSSACSCAIAVVLSVSFARVSESSQSGILMPSQTTPQYIVLGLLIFQVVAQTVIRYRATEVSDFDNTDWPWSSATSHASSAVFSFDELATRLVLGSVKNAALTVAIASAKFFLLNYVAISQIAMVVAGIASSRASSAPGIETSSVVIGSIPLITSATLLLHNAVKLLKFLWKKWCRKPTRADHGHCDEDLSY